MYVLEFVMMRMIYNIKEVILCLLVLFFFLKLKIFFKVVIILNFFFKGIK